MVATRSGTCVSSSDKNTNNLMESGAEGTPSTIRRSQRRTVIVTTQPQSKDQRSTDSQQVTAKKETRSSKRQSTNKQPDSTNEADESESESCCSDVQALSEMQPTSLNRRRVQKTSASVAQKETSNDQLCFSPSVKTPRRSTRGLKKLASVSAGSATPCDDHSDADSCSSVVSLSRTVETRMITRALRKTAVHPEEAVHSEPFSSVVSSPSDTKRSTAKSTVPKSTILEQSEDIETPSMTRRTRGSLSKAKLEEQVYESDGCQSGPSFSPVRTTCGKAHGDSDSESLSTGFMSHESSGEGKATPCSSRTGSRKSSCSVGGCRTRSRVQVKPDVLNIFDDEREPQTKTSEGDDIEMIEEEETDKTLTGADLECTIREDAPFHKDDVISSSVELVKCEKSGSSEDTDDKTQAEVMEGHHDVDKELDALPTTAKTSVTLTEKQLPDEKTAEERLESDCEVLLDHKASEPATKSVVETEKSRTSTKINSNKEVFSLLDSSDDEIDAGLSDEERCEDVGDLVSEEETCADDHQPGPSKASGLPIRNGLFVIDTRPGLQPREKYYIDATQHEKDDSIGDSKATLEEEDFVDEDDDEGDEDSKVLFTTRKPAMTTLSSSIDPGLKLKELGGLYISFDGTQSKSVSNNLNKLKELKKQDELLKKSVISPDFEKKDAVPPYKESKQIAKMKRREERAKTTGDGWFNMKAPELTEELKNDLRVLKMRSALDPKRFYKKNDREGFPKYFEVGTVVDNPSDFYHSRIPKKQRKRTIVEELLADADFRSFNKRKYQEIMTEKAKEASGKMKKKKKNHKKN